MPWHFLGGQNGDLANNEFSWSYISHNISNELVAYHQKMGLEPSIFIAQLRKKHNWNIRAAEILALAAVTSFAELMRVSASLGNRR